MAYPKMTDMNNVKEQIKNWFLLTQKLEALAQEDKDFLNLVTEAEEELESEEYYLLGEVSTFVNDLESAITENYDSMVEYWKEH